MRLVIALLVLSGCGVASPFVDAGGADAGSADSGQSDAGQVPRCGLGALSDGGTVGDLPDGGEHRCGSNFFCSAGACLSTTGDNPCFDDSDCPSTTLFFCDASAGKCAASCRKAADCSAAVRGPYALAACSNGCACNQGRCVP